MAEPAVVTRSLTKRFGEFTAVGELSLEVARGEIFGLLGSNGAGKSTAIRMLCGLLTPTSGSATVLGLDVAKEPEAVKRSLGYMTQRFSLYEDLSVAQNLRFYSGVYGLAPKRRAEREAWAVGMAGLGGKEEMSTRALPGGWRQRLALACALMHEPTIVFLDEPTGSVDPLSRRSFWSVIDSLAADGTTVIVTTHHLDEAEHCHRIALMHAGRLVALGSTTELKAVFAGRAILEVRAPRPLDALETLEKQAFVREVSLFGASLHVVVDEAAAASPAISRALEAAGNSPVQVSRALPSLEDVFIHTIETEDARRAASTA